MNITNRGADVKSFLIFFPFIFNRPWGGGIITGSVCILLGICQVKNKTLDKIKWEKVVDSGS